MKKLFKQFFSMMLIAAMIMNMADFNTTYAASAPAIVSVTPSDEATGVSVNASMIINFDQPMYTSGGYSSGFFGASFTFGSQSWSNGNKTCTIPMQGLQFSTSYRVSIGQFWNSDQNQCSNTLTINFTTEDDTYPPTVTGTSPANNAVNATVSSPISVSFSEGMKTTVGMMTVAPTDAPTSTVGGSTAWSNGNTTLTFSHPTAFEPNKNYTVKLIGFQDGPGNVLPAYTFSFTTYTETTPPQLSSHTPVAGASNVAINTSIVLNFNEKMNTYAGGITVMDALSNPVSIGAVVWSNGSKTATYTPTTALAYGTVYTVTLNSFKDESNNDLSMSSFTFTTKEQEKTPTPSIPNPHNTFTFSNSTDTTAIFPLNPHAPSGTTYKVYVSDDAVSPVDAGIALVNVITSGSEITDLMLYFTSPSVRPTVNTDYYISATESGKAESQRVKVTIKVPIAIASSNPTNGAAEIAKNTDIILDFGRGIQVIGWEEVSIITVVETANPSNNVTGTKAWSNSNQILTFSPDLDLKPGTQYTVSYSNFNDIYGIPVLPSSFTFATAKDTLTASDLSYNLSPVTYNGGTQPLTVTGNTDVGEITVKYEGVTAVPKNASTYIITADVTESAKYKAVTGLLLGSYTISKKDVTISGVTAVDKEFAAGDTSVALDFSEALVNGRIGSDAVVPSGGSGTMDDDAIGDNKPVTITGIALSGVDAGNYNLIAQPTDVTVNIVAPLITVTSITVKKIPSKTTYTVGESLELDGFEVTLHKSDGSTEDIAFADFGTNGITVSPVNGTSLTTSYDKVTIIHTVSGKSVEQTITVNSAAVTSVITPADAVINDTNISATVENNITSQVIDLLVSTKASWKLYSDANCTSEIADKTMILSVGANTAYVQVIAEDSSTKVYTLIITRQDVAQTGIAPSIITKSIKDGVVGELYNDFMTADGDAPITWSLESGSLPMMLNLASDGKIIGVPMESGTFTFTVKATNGTGSSIQNMTITVHSLQYVAFGDSIAAGYGLTNPADSYVSIIKGTLGLPAANMAMSGLSSTQLLTILNGMLPQQIENLSDVKMITLSIGSNDVLAGFLGIIASKLGCNVSDIQSTLAGLSQPQLAAVLASLNADDGSGLKDNPALKGAASNFETNFQSIISKLKAYVPDAKIYVTNVYNPYEGISIPYGVGTLNLGEIADSYIHILNQAFNSDSTNYTLIDAYSAFSDELHKGKYPINTNIQTFNFDPHPNVYGHALIAGLILAAQGPEPVIYTVTFNLDGGIRTGGGELIQNIAQGCSAIAPTIVRNGYTFTGWDKSFANVSSDLIVTATWSKDGNSESGTGIGNTPSIPSASNVVTEKQIGMPTTAKMSTLSTVKDGVLTATITEQMVKDAIKMAQDSAKNSGVEADGIALDFNVINSDNYANLNFTIDAEAIDKLKEAKIKFIKLSSSVLDISFDTGAITEIDEQSTGTVAVLAKSLTKLSNAAKKLIGNRPVFNITVGYQKNGKAEYVSSFGKGAVTLDIAYKVADKENTKNLFGVYIDKNGNPELLINSSYADGKVIFNRNSLSSYGIGYKAPVLEFTDTEKHWAKDNIDFVVSSGLISGISEKIFNPDTPITRADFLMALGRISGGDMSGYKTSSFMDVKSSDSAMPYIEWAVENHIVQGIGEGKFGAESNISRQDMAVMMQNYAKSMGYRLPVSFEEIIFSDSEKIADYAKASVMEIQKAGIMKGKGNNQFDPIANASRAEASSILRRFMEFAVEKGIARGWSQNDTGQWQYINEKGQTVVGWRTVEDATYYFNSDGIMVFGQWLEIDGKWYYFYEDGVLAKSVKIKGYEVDENGVRKAK